VLIRILHRLFSHPLLYDMAQVLAGAREVRRRVGRQVTTREAPVTVLDLGGGTGAIQPYLPGECRYICADMEMPKLRGFRRGNPRGWAVQADGMRLPIRSSSCDAVICMFVAHHLEDEPLRVLLGEAKRVLRGGGELIFLDGVMARDRLAGRLLWWLDRGSNPRPKEALRAIVGKEWREVREESFAVWHEYWLMAAVKSCDGGL